MGMAGKYLHKVIATLMILILLAVAGCSGPGAATITITKSASISTGPAPTYSYPMGGIWGPGGIMGPGGMMGTGATSGSGGMMGSGSGGMMGPGGPYRGTNGQRITMDRVIEIGDNFLKSRNDLSDFKISEAMEFSFNFYLDFVEKGTGVHALEALVDPFTGDLYPEPGPNMMWNLKYGGMPGMVWGSNPSSPMTVSADQGKNYAQTFIDGYLPGAKAGEPHRFYGYYTLDFSQNNEIYGMLSVNGFTGQVWFHSWHGPFIAEREIE